VSTCEGIIVGACHVITGGNLSHSSYSSLLETECRHNECAIHMQSNQGIHLQYFCRVCIIKNFVKITLTDSAMYKNNKQNCGKNTNNKFTAGKTQNTKVR
jgi:hypothetical protein